MSKIIIYTDGGSRGNPGPSAVGVVIQNEKGETLKSYGEYIGEGTNNEAEYKAIIFGLKKMKHLFGKEKTKAMEVEIRVDSELAFRQLTGKYKIESENIKPLFIDVWNLKFDFKNISFKHIPREQNSEADKMANRALDAKTRGQGLF